MIATGKGNKSRGCNKYPVILQDEVRVKRFKTIKAKVILIALEHLLFKGKRPHRYNWNCLYFL